MSNKTATNGYYTLPNNQGLHFSMNAWYNLKENTGKELHEFGVVLDNGSDIEKAFALGEIIFAAAKANNQEEGEKINFNIYTVRGWFGDVIGPEEIEGITKALLWNTAGALEVDPEKK